MKVSRKWLQKYFDKDLPNAEEIGDALTFHAFEIEEIEKYGDDDVLDVKILPDRAAYALSHRGIAKEVGASIGAPMSKDPFASPAPEFPKTAALTVTVEDDTKCLRYMGAIVRGVKVGPSPAWLKEALESVGQRSINNVVDATNYVMLDIGQPLHAFDAARLTKKIEEGADGGEGTYAIAVRGAKKDEKITTLTNEEFALPEGTLLITDANASAGSDGGNGIGIAGVKGGKAAEITTATTDLIIEAANFDGTSVRKTAQALKLWTDASLRFQNRPSPMLAAYGMRDVLALIQDVAGGELGGVVDVFSELAQTAPKTVAITRVELNGVLGTEYTDAHISNALQVLGLPYLHENELFTITPPFERKDLVIMQDLVEEIGRTIGYDQIIPVLLPALSAPADQARYRGIERIKDVLIERGFTEISTQSFTETGDIMLANPLDLTRPALRAALTENMRAALARGTTVAPRVLGPASSLQLFEIGTVFEKDNEHLSLVLGYAPLVGKYSAAILAEATDALKDLIGELPMAANSNSNSNTSTADGIIEINLATIDLAKIGERYEPAHVSLGAYKPFSIYPFALRDVAVWTSAGTEQDEVENLIIANAGELLARIDLFDRFEKTDESGTRISYAFRLVFESNERTLSDEDLNPIMDAVSAALNAKEGWQVR